MNLVMLTFVILKIDTKYKVSNFPFVIFCSHAWQNAVTSVELKKNNIAQSGSLLHAAPPKKSIFLCLLQLN